MPAENLMPCRKCGASAAPICPQGTASDEAAFLQRVANVIQGIAVDQGATATLKEVTDRIARLKKSLTSTTAAMDKVVRCKDCVHCVGKDDTCLSCDNFSQYSPRKKGAKCSH